MNLLLNFSLPAYKTLEDAAIIDIKTSRNFLSTALGRVFTISTDEETITLEIILNATSADFTFPSGSLCISDGEKSNNNILSLVGQIGDKYTIGIIKMSDSSYRIISVNFGHE